MTPIQEKFDNKELDVVLERLFEYKTTPFPSEEVNCKIRALEEIVFKVGSFFTENYICYVQKDDEGKKRIDVIRKSAPGSQ